MIAMEPVRCFLIDDEKEATSRLAILLGKIEDIKIAGIYNDPALALEAVGRSKPDLVFLDVEMPAMTGFEFISAVNKSDHIPTYIFVTGYDQYAIKAIRNAAFDFLVKPVDLDELKEAISRYRGVKPHTVSHKINSEKFNSLSDREKEIVKLLVQCKNSREIGEILFISKNTVDTHRRHILEKLELKNAYELIAFAKDNNLI